MPAGRFIRRPSWDATWWPSLTKMGYAVDRNDYIRQMEAVHAELERRIADGFHACEAHRPRILWTGLGNSLGCDKVLNLVEESGAVVVCQEGCGGVTRLNDPIDTQKDPLTAIAERYLRVNLRMHDAEYYPV